MARFRSGVLFSSVGLSSRNPLLLGGRVPTKQNIHRKCTNNKHTAHDARSRHEEGRCDGVYVRAWFAGENVVSAVGGLWIQDETEAGTEGCREEGPTFSSLLYRFLTPRLLSPVPPTPTRSLIYFCLFSPFSFFFSKLFPFSFLRFRLSPSRLNDESIGAVEWRVSCSSCNTVMRLCTSV